MLLPAVLSAEPKEVRIGVLAHMGKEKTLEMWTPTAAYLSSRMPGHSFAVVPLDFHEINQAVEQEKVDFVIANTAIYVELEARYGVTRISTVETDASKSDPTLFGGVIFCRSDRGDIKELKDLKGKTFAAVDETSLGGFLAALRELRASGMNPEKDFKELRFVQTHRAVVMAVASGTADAGTVRTDTLETMAAEGKIKMGSFRVINRQQVRNFTSVLSTRLYPEWPIAKLKATSIDIAEQVAVALMDLSHHSPPLKAAKIRGWTVPLDYQPVHEMMKELKVGPYKDYGKISLSDVFRLYWYWLAAGLALLLLMTVVTLKVSGLNRRLKETGAELRKSKEGLEAQVRQRTAALEKSNEELNSEISDRRLAEELLQHANSEWELTFNTIPDMIAILDDNFRIIKANKAMLDILGLSKDCGGMTCYSSVHGTTEPPEYCPMKKLLIDGAPHTVDIYEERLNAHLWVSVSPLFDAQGGVKGAVHVVRNITELKRIHNEVENAKTFLQKIIDSIGESVMVISPDFRVSLINSTARKACLGDGPMPEAALCHQLSHRRDTPCAGLDDPCPVKRVLEDKQPAMVTHRHFDAEGREFFVEILASPVFDDSGNVVKIIEASRDITEKLKVTALEKKLEEHTRLEQHEKAISTLASGIAHDFNNALMGVMGNAELLSMKLPADGMEQGLTSSIIRSAEYMADLTSQLLAYARGGKYQPAALELPELIEETLRSYGKPASADIKIITEFQRGIKPVYADRRQLGQAVMNMLANAVEALEGSKGRILIRAENALDRPGWQCRNFRRSHPAGNYVHLSISDTGQGISEELHRNIFDPFFSTKFVGRGLGLASVAGTVHNHGGCISVESAAGNGATFHIYLPCIREKDIIEPAAPELVQERPAETVFLVDDNVEILKMLEEALKGMGHMVRSFSDSLAALEAFKTEKDLVHLAILDVQMPNMDGRTLLAEMKTLKPDLKVIMSSGYDESAVLFVEDEMKPDGFIQKPYRAQDLKNKIDKVMMKEA